MPKFNCNVILDNGMVSRQVVECDLATEVKSEVEKQGMFFLSVIDVDEYCDPTPITEDEQYNDEDTPCFVVLRFAVFMLLLGLASTFAIIALLAVLS